MHVNAFVSPLPCTVGVDLWAPIHGQRYACLGFFIFAMPTLDLILVFAVVCVYRKLYSALS